MFSIKDKIRYKTWMFLMHWITIRYQDNSCANITLRDTSLHVTRLCSAPRSDSDWERDTECRARGPGGGPRHCRHSGDITHFLIIIIMENMDMTSLYSIIDMKIMDMLSSPVYTLQAYTTHFSFPFKMTNDTLSPVGQNRMQQCRDNISRVISGHSKQTLPWGHNPICQWVVLVHLQMLQGASVVFKSCLSASNHSYLSM